MGLHSSAGRPRVRIPLKPRKFFFSGYFRSCLNCYSLRWSHTHFMFFESPPFLFGSFSPVLLELFCSLVSLVDEMTPIVSNRVLPVAMWCVRSPPGIAVYSVGLYCVFWEPLGFASLQSFPRRRQLSANAYHPLLQRDRPISAGV